MTEEIQCLTGVSRFTIFEIRKSAENPEISKIGRKKCSHVPMFPEIFQKTSPAGRRADRPRPMSPPAGRGSERLGFGIRKSLLQVSRKNQAGGASEIGAL